MADDAAIVRRVREFLAAHRPPPGPVVVAVSGGPDSVALLRAFCVVRPAPLVAAHLNHQLRGADSDADEAFVGELARRLRNDGARIEYGSARRSVAAESVGENLEAAGRGVRYDWLAQVAREVGAGWVATGHTADDQAETVLFQLLRGTGLDGLAGIAACRPLASGVELARPLLMATRADVLAFLRELGQDYREDATNADVTRTRSRIRHELLPHLARHYNPGVVAVLGRLAAQAADWRRDQVTAAEMLLTAVERPRAGPLLVFDRAALAAAPRRRRRAVWRRVWQREGWPRQGMGFREWDRLAGLCRGGPAAVDLPGGVRARRHGPVIQVGPANGGT
ncbi:MAG TPA: tRNA lysidine(34) synthetase TilS [Gemmataceae bacterium]|jgi:tRNA(Ile)-lysidine synthase